MLALRSPGRCATDAFGLTILLLLANFIFSADARASGNLWPEAAGDTWFWKNRAGPGEVLAGTWWAANLSPGKSYRLTFTVNSLRGKLSLLLADHGEIEVDTIGSYGYDFTIVDGGKRRMILKAAASDTQVSVSKLVVNEAASAPEPAPAADAGTSEPDSPASDPQGNIWKNSFGQQWFYETAGASGQPMAGTSWESALLPGNTYKITFNVKSLRGKIAVLVGSNPAVEITQLGSYAFDFNITEGGERRMLFQSASSNAAVSVTNIWVTRSWSAPAESAEAGSSSGKGHYLSFDRTRNLKTEMLDLVQEPHTAKSNYHLRIAQDLDAAIRTSGVAGIWMGFKWRSREVGDGEYEWNVLDANMDVAGHYGLKFVVKVGDRSFNGSTDVMPAYFPSEYVLWSSGGGKTGVVSKRWDPYVYNRLIRLYTAIANRYADHPAFGGIATAETATGNTSGDYTTAKYRQALTQIATQTQAALTKGKFFLFLNFLDGGQNPDMNLDQRVALVRDVPHARLAIGGPDITPDVAGMPGSASSYRIHVNKTMPDVAQFCHAQHVDHGQGGRNVKSNQRRNEYFAKVERIRDREQQYWFKGTPAVFQFDDLRDPNGNQVDLHPSWVLGDLWQLDELFQFGQRNFGCDYMFWHYREHTKEGEFGWPDSRTVILGNPLFYDYN